MTDPSELISLIAALPLQTLILREQAAELTDRLAQLFPSELDSGSDPGTLHGAAWSFSALANRLSALGRSGGGAGRGGGGRAALPRPGRDAARRLHPRPAMSLNNLADTLRSRRGREEALAAARRPCALRRTWPQPGPTPSPPTSPVSLNNLANMLPDLGRREEALAAARRRRGPPRPGARAARRLPPTLPCRSTTSPTGCATLGRREEALAAAEEAVALYRDLAGGAPDAFTPDLAMSLNNLANMLGARPAGGGAGGGRGGRRGSTAPGRARPDAFTPDLAMSLNNLANAPERSRPARGRRWPPRRRPCGSTASWPRPGPTPSPPTSPCRSNNLANSARDSRPARGGAGRGRGGGRDSTASWPSRGPTPSPPTSPCRSTTSPTVLSDSAGREEALAAAEEAWCCPLPMRGPTPSPPSGHLAQQPRRHAERSRPAEAALAATEEAVRLYRALAETPDAFAPTRSLALGCG